MDEIDSRDQLLLLETINPLDLTEEDLVEIAQRIREVVDIPIGVAYEDQHGAGVSWHEVIHIWLPNAEYLKDKGWDLVLTIIIREMRHRFSRKGNDRRPKTLIVRDPVSNDVLMTLEIQDEISDPKEGMTDNSPRRRPRLRRRID